MSNTTERASAFTESTTLKPDVLTEALHHEWRELLVHAAGGDVSLAALTSARLLRSAQNPLTPEETQVAIEGFFVLGSEQAAAVMTKLLAEEHQLAA